MVPEAIKFKLDKSASLLFQHGRLNGSDPLLPALFLGSHYDTVLDAGRLVSMAGFLFCSIQWNLCPAIHRYDGPLGIITAIAAVKMAVVSKLGEEQEASWASGEDVDIVVPPSEASGVLKRTVHIVAFTDEEGVRFQSTFLGSRALVRGLAFCLSEVNDLTLCLSPYSSGWHTHQVWHAGGSGQVWALSV